MGGDLGIYWNNVYLLVEVWRVFIKKKGDNRKKRFYSEIWENAAWGGLVKILWDSPCATVLWKLFLPKAGSLLIWLRLVGWLRVAYVILCILYLKSMHKIVYNKKLINMHTGSKLVSGYSYHYWVLWVIITGCIGVCLEEKKEQNELTPNIMQILLAKCQSARAACCQPAFMGSCLTISHMCMFCLTSWWGGPCVLAVALVLWGADANLGNGYGI